MEATPSKDLAGRGVRAIRCAAHGAPRHQQRHRLGAWPDEVAAMKRKTTTTRYDEAQYIGTTDESAAYLEACLEEADGDAAFVAKALGDIARAKGMSQVAREAGLSRARS